jgi:hypothetical protein
VYRGNAPNVSLFPKLVREMTGRYGKILNSSAEATTVYAESFFTQQMHGIIHNMVKCQKKLGDLEKSLIKWRKGKVRGKKPTARGVKKSVNGILSPQFMKDIFKVKVEEEKGLPALRYELNHDALDSLTNERLGRTVLVTDNIDWSTKQVIETYRSLTQIEEALS